MNFAQAFGENLKRLRAERDETQESLSAKSDLHRTVISQLQHEREGAEQVIERLGIRSRTCRTGVR